ncbi:hypothetical protein [Dyadobacter sp. CY312]|uniref:hypothetical protein n=1 Tax=Dyadobacter sp. CY312 TaxID=2907303 RepID=UPI001F1F4501|nr:hypothetical protein [Dyadobacter sp. CY312]MCE7042233.1 hypothetical protein [Dyadobacter sp. CY312]
MSEKSLRNLSIIYLLLPNLIFYVYWVNIPIAVCGVLMLSYLLLNDRKETTFQAVKIFSSRDLFLIGATTLFLTVVSGINGYVFQNVDYWGHNVKFYELFKSSWPIKFPKEGPVISYYYGFYVIPALVSKFTGSVNELVIFIWTWLGLTLGIGWVYIALNKRLIYVWLVLFIGDLPRVIKAVLALFSIRPYEFGNFGIENWSNFEHLLWVPNQTIPTLIIGGMFVYILIRRYNTDLLVLPIALSFWWAVFPSFVSGIIVGVLVIRSWVIGRFRLDWMRIGTKVIIPCLVCLPILMFFFSHNKSTVSGFLWQFNEGKSNVLPEYIINVGINMALFAVVYAYLRRMQLPFLDQVPYILIVSLGLLFPFYRLGDANDFLLRGMMPISLIIGMYLFYPLTSLTLQKTYALMRGSGIMIFLAIMLLTSSLIGLSRILRAATFNRFSALMSSEATFTPIPYDAYPNVYEVLKDKWSQDAANQYVGDPDSFYEKYMAPDADTK